jgi:hypoxanthine phosphoribosyltransferase
MKTLLSEAQIREGVGRLAGEITAYYENRPLTIVGVLTGSLVFLADLIRHLEMPLRIGLVEASSYRGRATSAGPLAVRYDMVPELTGREVLLVDDIFDTGHTLLEVMSQLDDLRPQSVRSAVLLRKTERQEVAISPHHVAFDIPNKFVVGYGLDYNDHYRNLPYVAVLDEGDLAR